MMSSFIIAQPPINERFNLGYDAAIFGSVIATDSCYYISSVGLNGFGLEVVGREPIECESNEINQNYLKTKRDKLGHLIMGDDIEK